MPDPRARTVAPAARWTAHRPSNPAGSQSWTRLSRPEEDHAMAHALTVVALFADRENAEQAVTKLVRVGFPPEHVGYLQPTDVREQRNPAKGAAEGIAAGATSGAFIGGVLGAVTVGLVPLVGPALVAGALLPVVMGAVTGSSAGAVTGGLFGAAATSEEEPYFMEEIQAGRILVSVEVPDTAAEA